MKQVRKTKNHREHLHWLWLQMRKYVETMNDYPVGYVKLTAIKQEDEWEAEENTPMDN